jgi:hypothetical protein
MSGGKEMKITVQIYYADLPCVSVMIWGCLSFNGIGILTDVKGNILIPRYIDVLENKLWPVIA